MKKKVCRCVCTAKVNGEIAGSYGMPVIRVENVPYGGLVNMVPICPRCGRGGNKRFKTADTALSWWNELQENLWYREGIEPEMKAHEF